MKRNFWKTALVTSVLSAAMCGAAFGAVSDTGFADVDADAWYADSITYCADAGIMNGTGGDLFSPNTAMTRAMFVSTLYRAEGSPAASTAQQFTDVSADAWYADAVAWAQENGIMSGYSATQFAPNETVTREQMASIFWRNAGSPSGAAALSFADTDEIAAYAQDAVAWAREAGILSGKDGNRFDPKGAASRAEVASTLYRWMNAADEDTTEETPETSAPDTDVVEPADEAEVLVAYFSATNTTEGVAELVAEALDADLFEIVPEDPYTAEDLNYNDSDCRANTEMNDPDARPAIANEVENMEDYDVVLLGFPIWHGDAPRIIETFLESYDFNGKEIVPFSTSGSSGIGTAERSVAATAEGAEVLDGLSVTSRTLDDAEELVAEWLEGLDLTEPAA